MKYYAVIDTNVLVSAMLKHHSVPGSIIDLAFDGPIIRHTVSTWLEEMKLIVISSVLVRKKRGQEHIHRFTVRREHIHCLAVRKEHIDKPCRCQLISSWE